MNELTRSLGEVLLASDLDHTLLLDMPDVFRSWQVTLRSGSQRIASELILDAAHSLFIWRVPLLKGAKKRSRLFFWVYGDAERAMAFHALAEGLPFARLLLNREDGAVLEVALPLPKTVSEESFQFLLTEMLRAFAMRGIVKRGLDGGEMEWAPDELPTRQPEHEPDPDPGHKAGRKQSRPQPLGRAAEIDQAIRMGDIALARRLASGEDIAVPDAI